MHAHDGQCEKRRACLERRAEGSSTSLMMVEIEADTIFETGITFTMSGLLMADSKRRLVKGAPSEKRAEWLAALGLDTAKATPRKERTKKR